ncbi:hypothetical protein ACGVWS_15355 [Enterobacteriaceae bacterium LUAb1]
MPVLSCLKAGYLKKTLEPVGEKNSGNPIALLPHDQREAPWMAVAIREAKKWHGTKEDHITSNYHALIGHRWIKNLVGPLNARCSSFVTYYFQESGYHKTAPDPYHAISFFRDNPNFLKSKSLSMDVPHHQDITQPLCMENQSMGH